MFRFWRATQLSSFHVCERSFGLRIRVSVSGVFLFWLADTEFPRHFREMAQLLNILEDVLSTQIARRSMHLYVAK